jgi:hypothetical protein
MTNFEQTDIEKIVMRRVYRIRMLRAILSSTVLAGLVLVAALWGIGREVWVAMVFQNGPQGFLAHALYLVYAFEHTRIIVQTLVLVCLASIVYLARETAKLLGTSFTIVHA